MLANFGVSFIFFDQSMEEGKLRESLPTCFQQEVCISQIQNCSDWRGLWISAFPNCLNSPPVQT